MIATLLWPLRELIAGALDLALPRHCVVTGRPLLADEPGCLAPEALRAAALTGPDYCTRCGAAQGSGVGVIATCPRCEGLDAFGTAEIVCVGDYDGTLRQMCLALKFRGARAVAQPLALYLAQGLLQRGLDAQIDLVTCIPLHVFRLLNRGYNQGALLAERVAKSLGKPFAPGLLSRTRRTRAQARLTALERRKNVEGAFAVNRPSLVADKRVLLIDDVLTTGSTLREASRALKQAGARWVIGGVIARSTVEMHVE